MVKRALLITFTERYFAIVINLITVAIAARFLTPAEFGVAAAGMSIFATIECVRDFGTGNFIVQARTISDQQGRTAFTIIVLASIAMAAILIASADYIAAVYKMGDLSSYLYIVALAMLLGPFSSILMAFIRREMDFQCLAIINFGSALGSAAGLLGLAVAGFGVMSFAWAIVIQYGVSAALSIILRPRLWLFKLHFRNWGNVISFGAYSSASDMLGRLQDLLTYFVLGRNLRADDTGIYSRASLMCFLPVKIVAVGLVPVALPAFAAHARDGRDLKQAYLQSVNYIMAVQWPGLLLLAFLAHPIVDVYLGPQWPAVAPLVQILAVAGLISSITVLNSPILLAFGAARHLMYLNAISVTVIVVAVSIATQIGLTAVAYSQLLVAPLLAFFSLRTIQTHLKFTWTDLVRRVRGSVVISAFSATGPIIVGLLSGSFKMTFVAAFLATCLAGIGWLTGLWITRHPLLSELRLDTILTLSDSIRLRRKRK